MADIVDLADTQVTYSLLAALSKRKKEPSKDYTGQCWFCDHPVEAPKRWCDADCRDMWERQ